MKKIIFSFVAACFLLTVSLPIVRAAAEDFQLFTTVAEIPVPPIPTPTVVEITFPGLLRSSEVAVVRKTDLQAQPIAVQGDSIKSDFDVVTNSGTTTYLNDNSYSTAEDFTVTEGETSVAQIELIFSQPTPISGVMLNFDQFSKRPDFVSLSTGSSGLLSAVLTKTRFSADDIRFPERTAERVIITLEYSQPLRIAELSVHQSPQSFSEASSLRFLAKPGEQYQLYSDPAQPVSITTNQVGNLFAEEAQISIDQSRLVETNNPHYAEPDRDGDSVYDALDNCPSIANPGQEDINSNGIGDVCDDTDFDGVINTKDNCPDDANSNQRDVDDDGIGDVCDGQESRFTEQYPWLPWLAIGGTALVISILVVVMVKSDKYHKKIANDENAAETKTSDEEKDG